MAKSRQKATDGDGDTGTVAELKTYAVLSPIKVGGKRVGSGTVDLDPEAEDTAELLAFGAIGEPAPEPEKPETESGIKPQE